jgi:4-hydroxy-tetrahydrodipicolinate synthase
MFQGSFPALVTPFRSDFSIDFDAYGRLVDFHLEQGSDGIVPCGCSGEAATLSHEEQQECIRFVVERVAGRVPVIAGTGSNNTAEAIRLTKYAKQIGCDGALLITPYYNKPTPAGQIAHYRAVAEAADIPIVLYNVPGRTGTRMMPETIAEMRKIPNIASIKEACGDIDQVSRILERCDINVLSGDDSLTLPMISVGAKGVISVAANVVPAKCSALCKAANGGDYEAARKLHYELLPLFQGLFFETNPMPVKACLAKMGMIQNILRLPLVAMTSESAARLDPILKKLGLI